MFLFTNLAMRASSLATTLQAHKSGEMKAKVNIIGAGMSGN
jgi:hypothetical protein